MRALVRKFRHLILFAALVGEDLLVGFIGHYYGTGGGSIIDYLKTVSLEDIMPIVVVAIIFVFVVEYLFRRS